MPFSRNEVILLPIPFTDLTSRKVRPAIVVGHSSHAGDVFVVPISIEDRLAVKSVGILSAAAQATLERRLRAWLSL